MPRGTKKNGIPKTPINSAKLLRAFTYNGDRIEEIKPNKREAYIKALLNTLKNPNQRVFQAIPVRQVTDQLPNIDENRNVAVEFNAQNGFQFSPPILKDKTLVIITVPRKNGDGTLSITDFDILRFNAKTGEFIDLVSNDMSYAAHTKKISNNQNCQTATQIDLEWLEGLYANKAKNLAQAQSAARQTISSTPAGHTPAPGQGQGINQEHNQQTHGNSGGPGGSDGNRGSPNAPATPTPGHGSNQRPNQKTPGNSGGPGHGVNTGTDSTNHQQRGSANFGVQTGSDRNSGSPTTPATPTPTPGQGSDRGTNTKPPQRDSANSGVQAGSDGNSRTTGTPSTPAGHTPAPVPGQRINTDTDSTNHLLQGAQSQIRELQKQLKKKEKESAEEIKQDLEWMLQYEKKIAEQRKQVDALNSELKKLVAENENLTKRMLFKDLEFKKSETLEKTNFMLNRAIEITYQELVKLKEENERLTLQLEEAKEANARAKLAAEANNKLSGLQLAEEEANARANLQATADIKLLELKLAEAKSKISALEKKAQSDKSVLQERLAYEEGQNRALS